MTRRLPLLGLLAVVVAAGVGVGSAPAASSTTTCPDTNAPNELVLSAGTDQTAQIGRAFGTSFQVELANTNGCSVTGNLAGVGVEFVAPTGDTPGGTFGSGGTNTVIVGTNSSGEATAPTFTANDVVGTYAVFAISDYGTVKLTATNSASGVVASIATAGGSGQAAAIDAGYAAPLRVRVTDPNGRAVQGATVTFAVAASPYGAGASFLGSGAQATGVTDADGVAISPLLVANGTAGAFTATASTTGIASVATFALENRAAAAGVAAARSTLAATVGTRYPQRLAATVRDASGNAVEGATVTFAVTAGAGGAAASFLGGGAQATATTDANGLATAPALVANTTAGDFTATASVAGGGTAASYALRNRTGKAHAVAAGAAVSESARVDSRFPVRLAVTVTDADGNAVAGTLVTFAAPAHGASGRFGSPRRRVVRVRTDADGIAVAPPFRANAVAGGYAVRARVRGVARPAAFALVNEPRGA
jgi:hypothetical protein